MANFCTHCGAALKENAKFCTVCGAKTPTGQARIPQHPAQSRQAAPQPPLSRQAVPRQTPQPTPQASRPGTPSRQSFVPPPYSNPAPPQAKPSRGLFTAGGILSAAFLCVGCLPYLLKSLLFLARQDSLGTVLCTVLDLLGMAAGAAVLGLGSKRLAGKVRLSAAVLLAALLPGLDGLDLLLVSGVSLFAPAWDLAAAVLMILIRLLAAGCAVWALSALFLPERGTKQGGRLPAWLCAVPAFFAPDIVMALWNLSPLADVSSFLATFSIKALVVLVEVCAFAAAAWFLRRKPGKATGKPRRFGLVPLAAGLGLAALAVITSLTDGARMTVAERAVADVNSNLSDGELMLSLGDMDEALFCFETAAAHCDAWRTVAEGEAYQVPEKLSDDVTLNYLSYVNGDLDQLRLYLAKNLDEEQLDVWCPLMIRRYREKAETEALSEYEQVHLADMLRRCVAEEYFVFEVPGAEEIREAREPILEALVFPASYEAKMEMAEAIDRLQRGRMSIYDGVDLLLSVAEKYPEELMFQYIAASVGSENRWDSAGHYGRTADAIDRYRALWLEQYGAEASAEERSGLDSALATMLINMRLYDRAIPLLESALETDPDNLTLMQQLAFCYSSSRETEKGYELNKRLYQAAGDDASVIWSYCIGALKHGEKAEAIRAASRLAELVRTKLNGNQNHEDEMLFNLVFYLGVNDNAGWTDYTYRVYSPDGLDPELLALFEQNEFLYNYVQAAYWERDHRYGEAALPFAQKALSMQENSGRLWYLNAIINYDLRDYEKALECYKRADALEPDDPSILYGLANVYDALEDYQTAYTYCVRALAPYQAGVDHSYDYYGVSYHARALLNRLIPYVEVDD